MEYLFEHDGTVWSPDGKLVEVPSHAEIEAHNQALNDAEILAFRNDAPEKIVCYVKQGTYSDGQECWYRGTCVTWLDGSLGTCELGKWYRSGFGDQRRTVRMHASNGYVYSGTEYGTFARMTRTKTRWA